MPQTIEEQMYEVQHKKITNRAVLLGIFLSLSSILVFTYLLSRHAESSAIGVDACKSMCTNGIEKYESGSCYCVQPKVEVPTRMDCTCKPSFL